MDFNKKYKEYLDWRLEYVQSGDTVNRGFDRHHFRKMELDELIWFRESFIAQSAFVPTAKNIVIESMDAVIAEKREQRRDERIDEILG
jgi:hypothetical protein